MNKLQKVGIAFVLFTLLVTLIGYLEYLNQKKLNLYWEDSGKFEAVATMLAAALLGLISLFLLLRGKRNNIVWVFLLLTILNPAVLAGWYSISLVFLGLLFPRLGIL